MGRQINQSIVIDARVKTTLEGMEEVVSKLNKGLREGTTKVDLTKGVGASLSKNIEKFKDEYSKFSKFIEGGKIEFADAKDAVKSGETLIKTFRELKRIAGDFNDLSVLDAKRLFPEAFDSRVGDLLGGLEKLASSMQKFESKSLDLATAQSEMSELREKAVQLQAIIDQESTLKISADQAQKSLDGVEKEIEAIRKKASEGITLKINTAKKEKSEAESKRDEILSARTARGFNEDDFAGSRTGSTKFKGKTLTQWSAEGSKKGASEATKAEAQAALEAIRLYEREKNALADLSAIIADREKQAKQLSETLARLGTIKLPEVVAAAGGAPEEIMEATAAVESQKDAFEANAEAQGKYKIAAAQAGKAKKEYESVTSAIETWQTKIDKLTIEVGSLKKEVGTVELEKAFSAVGVEGFSAEMLKSKEGIEQLREKLNALDQEKLDELKKQIADMGFGADAAEQYIEQLRGAVQGVGDSANDIKRSADEIDNLKKQVLDFFSLTNSVQLFKRAVTSAMNTVKELDATMTEAAVVTEFDVGDMWDKLPEYAKNAQELGVSINGLYEATTLYYQQGLRTNEAMALGIETMKMAKIAGLETTDATKAMTAALRGFNMALNEASAIRINDVYSQLAAVTAADVGQISTAMEKTASIAASANMEFETTAALLAQIIETTQEAPETAGTALKTIIARFSEVKNLRASGQSSGKDSEGEDIDVNRIQVALKTVGISMEGFFAGTEGLDSILLKLAEKWEGLDFETQRYIATMAAGSRQQSRFIAMMSNYARTTELVEQANNSSGASQEQFNKTLDSMASKLQSLKNAWDQFVMGLANNTLLKGAVDIVSSILGTINKMTSALSGGSGLIKSIVTLGSVLSLLKVGKTAFSKGFGIVGSMFGLAKEEPRLAGQEAGKQAAQGVSEGIKQNSAKSGKGKTYFQKAFGKKIDGQALREARQKFKKNPTMSGLYDINSNMGDNKLSKKEMHEVVAVYKTEGIEAAQKKYKALQKDINGVGFSLDKMGSTAIAAGAAVGMLGGLFDALGLDGAANAVSKLSAALMGLGTVMTTVSMMNKGMQKIAVATKMTLTSVWVWAIGIVAAVATIATIIKTISKRRKEKSVEYQLKKTNKTIDQLSKATEEAKQEINDLAAAREDLEKMQDTFKGLVKGSQEWKEALVENNEKVLGLLKTYPELAGYVSKGINGELIITDAGWEAAEATQRRGIAATVGATAAANKRKGGLELFKGIKGDIQNIFDSTIAYTFAAQAAEKGLSWAGSSKDEFRDFFVQLGYNEKDFEQVWGSIQRLGPAFDELANSALGAAVAQESRVDSAISGAVELSTRVTESEYGSLVTETMSESFSNYDADIEARASMIEVFAHGLTDVYAEIMGMDPSEAKAQYKNGTLSSQTIAYTIAAAEKNDEITATAENTVGIFEKVLADKDKETSRKFSGLMTDNGLGLALGDVKEFAKKNKSEMKKYLETLGFDDKMAKAMGFKNLADYADHLVENAKEADKAYKQIFSSNYASGWGDNLKKPIETFNTTLQNLGYEAGLTVGQTQALVNSLADVYANGGDAKAVLAQFSTILENVDPAKMETAVDILTSTDWTMQDSVDTTIEALEELGVEIDKELVQTLYAAARTVKSLNLEKLENELKSLDDLAKTVSSRAEAGEKTFSKEERDALIEQGIGIGEFVRVGIDEYVFTGETNDLLDQINEHTLEILTQMREDIDNAIASGEKIESLFEEGREYTVGDGTKGKTTGASMSAEAIVKSLKFGGLDLVGEGGTKNIGLETLQMLALDMGAVTAENIEHYDAQGLIDAIISAYDNYLVPLDQNRQKREQDAEEYSTTEAAQTVGTQEFVNQYLHPGAAEPALTTVSALNSTAPELSALVAGTEVLIENIDASNKLTSKQESLFAKNFAQMAYKNAKSIDKLNKVIGENVETLLTAKDGSLEYQTALNLIATQAKDTFGITQEEAVELVEAHKGLFAQLARGGEAAQLAYQEIGKILAGSYVSSLGRGIIATEAFNTALNGLPTNIEIGVPFDASEAMNGLIKLGMTAAEAQTYLSKLGYTVQFDEWWMDPNSKAMSKEKLGSNWVRVVYATGVVNDTNGTGAWSPKGGGGSNKFENSLDKFYNTYEKINAILREREAIERRYDRLLQKRSTTGQELLDQSKEQVETLQAELEQQKILEAGKMQEIDDLMAKNSKYNKSYGISFDKATGAISINWEAINKIRNNDTGQAVLDYISKLEGLRDQYQDSIDAQEDIYEQVAEINERGKDEYFDLEERIKEALLWERQEEIDRLTEINDSINDTNSRILDSLQEQIDEYRQNRDNEKTEKELEDKQRRLAYLQQDTSGANATEILKLQKEIEEGQEDYTDQLIDQKISELQKQNDKAAEQRERQIELLENQKTYLEESGALWQRVYELWETGVDETGAVKSGSDLEKLLMGAEGFGGLSILGQKQWQEDLADTIAQAFEYTTKGRRADEGQTVEFKTRDGEYLTGTADKMGNITTKDGSVYTGVHENIYGDWVTKEDLKTAETSTSSGGAGLIGSLPKTSKLSREQIQKLQRGINHLVDDGLLDTSKLTEDGVYGNKTKAAVRALQKKIRVNADGVWGPKTLEAFLASELKAYKTGGLADFTGPAWLDGTKSKPEYILSADQTKAFFTLVDVLGSLQAKDSQTTQNSGDRTYDIDINVESIGSDYDVEQLADTVKRLINEDARYRNNNTINLMR